MKSNDLNYYKQLNYSIVIENQTVDDETWFIAYCKEFGKFACYGRGDSQVEALHSFVEEKNAFLEYLFNESMSIPEPINEDSGKFSGIFNVRTSPILHASLVSQAKDMNISLNLYLNQIIAAAVERRALEDKIMDKLQCISTKLEEHHYEVTNQLRYKINKPQIGHDWQGEYCGPYQKIA